MEKCKHLIGSLAFKKAKQCSQSGAVQRGVCHPPRGQRPDDTHMGGDTVNENLHRIP